MRQQRRALWRLELVSYCSLGKAGWLARSLCRHANPLIQGSLSSEGGGGAEEPSLAFVSSSLFDNVARHAEPRRRRLAAAALAPAPAPLAWATLTTTM